MKRNINIPRQHSLIQPEIKNPFTHSFNFTVLDMIQIAFMSITIAPVRLASIAFLLILAWLFAYIALTGRSEEEKKKPLEGWRKSMMRPITLLGRALVFCHSFQNIKIKGRQATPEEAPMLIAGPHSSFFDGICFFYCSSLPSSVSRMENMALPFLGSLIEFTQPVVVNRTDANSRINTIKEIDKRAHSGGKWPQIIIFPEGTCTNRSCLINYKPGAFYPGVPVQPVCLRYRNRLDTYTWTWEGPGALALLWFTLCQFHTNVEIEFLPVYKPSEDELKDAKLFASNVRAEMAKCLDIPVTDHTFDDCRLMQKAAKLKLPKSAGLVEFQKLNSKLGLKFDTAYELLDKFGAIGNRKGKITYEEFAEYLHLPPSEALLEVFSLYDRDGSRTIDFREYVIGLSLVSSPANTEETIRYAFQLFDEGNKGYITRSELSNILYNAFNMEEIDSEILFEEVDADNDGRISYEEFQNYANQKPEYAMLFKTYHDTKANGHLKSE